MLRIKRTTYNRIVKQFYITVITVSKVTLVYYLLRNQLFIQQHMPTSSINPNTKTTKCLLRIQSYQHTLTDKFHVINRSFLSKTIHQLQLLKPYSLHKLIHQNLVRPTHTQHIIVLKQFIIRILNCQNCSFANLNIRQLLLKEFFRSHQSINSLYFWLVSRNQNLI